jgi:hypothetical protein
MIKLTDERMELIARECEDKNGVLLFKVAARAIEAEVLRLNGGGGEELDGAKLQALGWQRIVCPVCGTDGARAAPQPQQAAQKPQEKK